jgi:hypothetical protein
MKHVGSQCHLQLHYLTFSKREAVHARAGEDIGHVGEDLRRAGEDVGRAGEDVGRAGDNVGWAGEDVGRAGDNVG